MSIHKDRVVLAYSGGLDTSVAIGWIGEATGREVVAVAVIVDRATGAKEHIEEVAGVPCFYAYSKDDLGLD